MLRIYQINVFGACRVACALGWNTTVKSLDLTRVHLKSMWAKDFCWVLEQNQTLKEVNLSKMRLKNKGVIYVAARLFKNKSLEILHLDDNRFNGVGVEHLLCPLTRFSSLQMQANVTLKSLIFGGKRTKIGRVGLIAILRMLSTNQTLTRLAIYEDQSLRPQDIIEIFESPKTNVSLKCLSLQGCKGVDGDFMLNSIIETLQVNPWIEEIDLARTPLQISRKADVIHQKIGQNENTGHEVEVKLLKDMPMTAPKSCRVFICGQEFTGHGSASCFVIVSSLFLKPNNREQKPPSELEQDLQYCLRFIVSNSKKAVFTVDARSSAYVNKLTCHLRKISKTILQSVPRVYELCNDLVTILSDWKTENDDKRVMKLEEFRNLCQIGEVIYFKELGFLILDFEWFFGEVVVQLVKLNVKKVSVNDGVSIGFVSRKEVEKILRGNLQGQIPRMGTKVFENLNVTDLVNIILKLKLCYKQDPSDHGSLLLIPLLLEIAEQELQDGIDKMYDYQHTWTPVSDSCRPVLNVGFNFARDLLSDEDFKEVLNGRGEMHVVDDQMGCEIMQIDNQAVTSLAPYMGGFMKLLTFALKIGAHVATGMGNLIPDLSKAVASLTNNPLVYGATGVGVVGAVAAARQSRERSRDVQQDMKAAQQWIVYKCSMNKASVIHDFLCLEGSHLVMHIVKGSIKTSSALTQQAEQKLLQTTRDFHSCKQEEGQLVSSYVLKIKGYIDNIERFGHPVTLGLGVSLILIGLRKEYDGFVQNYNMYSMGKIVNELLAMLKLHEQTLPKNNASALNGLRASRKLKPGALSLYVGNGQHEAVEAIDAFYLCLPSGLEIVLNNCHYAPSITRGVISVSRLYEDGFVNRFVNNTIQVSRNNMVYFSAIPRDGYPKEMMGYSFYYPPENKVLVARNAEFLKNSLINQNASGSLEDLEIIQEEDTHPSIDTSLNHEEVDLEINEPQSDIVQIRRSTRTRHAPDCMCLYIDFEEHELGDLGDLANYKAALLDPDKWLFKKKTDMDGNVHTHKARLVVKGYTQTLWIDYEETFSPVADIRAIRILIAIVAYYNYEIWQMDVKTAFLDGYLNEEVYMEQPEGEAAYILGIKIYRDRSRRLIGLCQSDYIEKILKRFCMENSKRGSIPMQEKLKLSKSQGASTPAELKRNVTSRFQQNLGDLHWTTVKNILKYLRNTKDVFLVYEGDLKRELRVSCYTDAEYLTDADDIKSQTRYVFILNGGAVDWKSAKQSIFATSSVEAEYIAAFDDSKEAVWVRKFIFRLGVVSTIEEPISMYFDNTRVIAIANESRIVKADPFTNALAFPKHSEHTRNIGMLPASSLMLYVGELDMASEFDQIILHLSRSNHVKKLAFEILTNHYWKLPSLFFTLQGLEYLEITNCGMPQKLPISLVRHKSLYLDVCFMEQCVFSFALRKSRSHGLQVPTSIDFKGDNSYSEKLQGAVICYVIGVERTA
nr:protein TORNADO 1 [Tanacetum cinerariifolium]